MTDEWQTVGPQNDPFAIDALRNCRRRFKERARSRRAASPDDRATYDAEELQRVLRRYPGDA